MESTGHVFVMHGDLLRLNCSEVLVPTDCDRRVERYWEQWAFAPEDLPAWSDEAERVTESVLIKDQLVRYVAVGTTEDRADTEWLGRGVRAGLAACVQDAHASHQWPSLVNRDKWLVAIPLFGTRAGGFDAVRGEALETVLTEASVAAKQGIDVAIVCRERSAYAAMQARRHQTSWPTLKEVQRQEAVSLGKEAKEGSLAIFLGAGVSLAAGLPIWRDLIEQAASPALRSDPTFKDSLTGDLPLAASRVRDSLRDPEEFIKAIRVQLPDERHAVAHGLIASMRIDEAVTTNFDKLFELAAKVPFGDELSVLPWKRQPGRPPWLLKLHGDIESGDLIITSEDYRELARHPGVLGSVVQSLLVTRHLVFVGYSLRDADFVELATGVADALERSGASHRRIGTVLGLAPSTPGENALADMQFVNIGDDDPAESSADARMLEIFLDQMAWKAAEGESSWVLDERYAQLLDGPDEKKLADDLRRLHVPKGERWERLTQLLADYGIQGVG